MNIGTLIRRARKKQKLTLKIVAEEAAISEGFLSQVENDVNSPSVDTLVRICNAIGIDAGNIITQANKQEKIIIIKKRNGMTLISPIPVLLPADFSRQKTEPSSTQPSW